MGDNYFDVDAALKDGHAENEVAAHLAQLHGINRDDYIKDGLTDSDFISEFKAKPLPGATTETTPTTAKDELSDVSNADNVLFGGIAAAAPGAAGYAFNKLKGTALSVAGVKGVPSIDTTTTATPSKTFASPSQVSARVTAAGQPPRPSGPTDVVNWASGKDDRTGQYKRGYLGGTSLEHEAALHKQADALEAKSPGYKIKPGTSNFLIPEAEYNKLVSEAKTAETSAKEALSNKAKMAAELRADRLAKINSTNLPAKIANNIASAPVAKRFMTGYNVGDLLQAQNPFEATVSTVGAAAPYGAGMVEKFVPQKYKGLAKLLGPVVSTAAPAINYLERKLIGPKQEDDSNINHAAGGPIQGYAGGKAVKGALDFLFKPRETQIMKASEALAPHEGKRLGLTQTDNFGVHGGRMGGNQFPNFQNINPLHQQHGVVWMNDSAKHAQDMIDRSNNNMIWSTYIGAPDQLKSNKSVAQDILNQHYQRDLSPEQIDLINQRIATVRAGKNKPLIFPQPFDIRDKFAAQELGLDTFARRAALADILGAGKGVGQTKGGIALPQYEDILRSHRDPLTEGAPTSSVGTRLFTVDNTRPTQRTDMYHPDYRDAVFGKDQQVQFERPVPQNLIVPNWYDEINARAPGKTHGNAWFSYMKDPQLITEGLLTNMQKEGFADGGEVQGYAGGKAVTGALEYIGKKILPAAEREANKAKYLENSAIKTPMYHGTSSDITEFKPKTAGTIFVTSNPRFAESFGDAHQKQMVKNVKDRMSNEEFMDIVYHGNPNESGYDRLETAVNLGLPARQNIMPVHVNATNPFDYENPQHVEALFNELNKADGAPSTHSIGHGAWDLLELPHVQAGIKNLGHDSYFVQEGGQKNLGLYKPTQLKSAIGNEGSFNPLDPDITKKEGGEIEGYAGGKAVGKVISQVPEVAQALEAYLRGHITNTERMDILNKHLPIRKWNELPPNYTNEQIRAALMANKQPKALAEVPVGMQVGNRLDIPAYTQNGVYVDTVHNAKGTPISYNRTGHLKDVEFSSKPNQAVRVGLGTKEQALTPLGAEIGSGKSPFALMKGTNIGTQDDEVRRMMQEYMNDPNWTQIGMDPRRNSQFYDKSTGLPVFSATEKLQSGPLVMVPKGGLESSHWEDPRLLLSDFEGKHYASGGHATPAWQRSEGKNPEGGLNAAGRASYNREHGAHLKAPQPEGGARRDSFCARMEGMKKKNTSSETAKDPDSRINKSLRKWNC